MTHRNSEYKSFVRPAQLRIKYRSAKYLDILFNVEHTELADVCFVATRGGLLTTCGMM